MKKYTWAILFVVFLTQLCLTAASAAERGTPEYEKMKEYKKAQRENKSSKPASSEKGFWQREAERSGFAGTGAMFGNAISSVIPLDKPNSLKPAKS